MPVAEDQRSQEEEQSESQRPGSAGEAVLSDLPGIIALRHARENQDFYGRRFASMDLAWDVVSQEEVADGYRVQLSYRLEHGFRANPGVEEFIIDRQGSVQSRLIVTEPPRRGGFLG